MKCLRSWLWNPKYPQVVVTVTFFFLINKDTNFYFTEFFVSYIKLYIKLYKACIYSIDTFICNIYFIYFPHVGILIYYGSVKSNKYCYYSVALH